MKLPAQCHLDGVDLDWEPVSSSTDYASRQFPVSSIRFNDFTHVIFFSIYPNSNGSLNFSQVTLDHLTSLVSRAHAQNTKVLICAGGWNLSGGFSPMAASSSARAAFIENMKNFCLTYHLDGVDLDWEPVSSSTDRTNYTLLIQQMKPVLAAEGLSLSIAVFAQGQEFLPAAISSIDWISVMAYDLGYPHSTYDAAMSAVDHWRAYGFVPSKIVLGVPFYGRDSVPGYFAYTDIVKDYHPAPEQDMIAGISYNGPATIESKTAWLVQNDYGGIMCWELTQDTTDSTSLLNAIAKGFHANSPPDFNGDNAIDAIDLRYVVEHWLMAECSVTNAWCGRADLDLSAQVTLTDVAVFAGHWLD
ncbi:MAG: glycoside hydrolase family 18 protein [Planctomycetaceae bacterium]|nr:glycoside hydrolase family 18 protein [Planctomycetaceae bacterium]